MKIKDLKSSLQKEYDAILPDVYSKVKAVPINNMLKPGSKEQQFRQKLVMRLLFATCCMFFSVLIVTAAFFISNFTYTPPQASKTYVDFYVAPSVGEDVAPDDYNAFELRIVFTTSDKVSYAVAVGDNAEILLDGALVREKSIKEMTELLLDRAYAENWFSEGDSSTVSISSANDVSGAALQVRSQMSAYVKQYFAEKERTVEVSIFEVSKSEVYVWAESLGVEVNSDMSLDELLYRIQEYGNI